MAKGDSTGGAAMNTGGVTPAAPKQDQYSVMHRIFDHLGGAAGGAINKALPGNPMPMGSPSNFNSQPPAMGQAMGVSKDGMNQMPQIPQLTPSPYPDVAPSSDVIPGIIQGPTADMPPQQNQIIRGNIGQGGMMGGDNPGGMQMMGNSPVAPSNPNELLRRLMMSRG